LFAQKASIEVLEDANEPEEDVFPLA
jgi:hypothetical protein